MRAPYEIAKNQGIDVKYESSDGSADSEESFNLIKQYKNYRPSRKIKKKVEIKKELKQTSTFLSLKAQDTNLDSSSSGSSLSGSVASESEKEDEEEKLEDFQFT